MINTQLRQLPVELTGLRQLSVLAIRGGHLESLPTSIGQLTNLWSLDICCQKLAELPEEIGQLTGLGSLDVSDNQLTRLPSSIGSLTNLYSLDLSNNPIPGPERDRVLALLAGVRYKPLLNLIREQKLTVDGPDRSKELEQLRQTVQRLSDDLRREQMCLIGEWQKNPRGGPWQAATLDLGERAPEVVEKLAVVFRDPAFRELRAQGLHVIGAIRPAIAVQPAVPLITSAYREPILCLGFAGAGSAR